MLRTALIGFAVMGMLGGSTAQAACAGDCGGDGQVAVNEVILAINIVLGTATVAQCGAADADGNGTVTIAELVQAVASVLGGCEAAPTPTATPPPSEAGRLVFLHVDQSSFLGEIFSIEADGSGRTNLTNTADRGEAQPSWSPDGERIVFTVDNLAVAVINADGSGRRVLVEGSERVGYPSWSPDGERIVFVASDFHSIDVINADGSGRSAVIAADEYEYQAPSFKPDGSQIAFVSTRAGGGEQLEIYLVPAGGGTVSRLTDDATENSGIDWSPTGVIAFNSFRTAPVPQSGLFAIDSDGGNERLLLAGAMFPGWSSDGSVLAFSDFNGLGVANADGSNRRTVPNTSFEDVDADIR